MKVIIRKNYGNTHLAINIEEKEIVISKKDHNISAYLGIGYKGYYVQLLDTVLADEGKLTYKNIWEGR